MQHLLNSSVKMPDPMTDVLATFRQPTTTGFDNAWLGMEPTFQTRQSVAKWKKMSAVEGGEDAYFETKYMLGVTKRAADGIKRAYQRARKAGAPHAMFRRVEVKSDLDQWEVRRQNIIFHWPGDKHEPFEVRFGLDPETFEYSIKPVPVVWLYDERFVRFMQEFLWDVPLSLGLSPSIAHGGAQFSVSVKTFLGGSLLADDIAARLDHPELSTWIMDWPNSDDRAYRATRERADAFQRTLDAYWACGFHPRAIGPLTPVNAYLDRGFGPAHAPPQGLMDADRGPIGSEQEIFQTNFAFGRAVRRAQSVHPGYWQASFPDEAGYRPDQIMRYSEGNLNRLQIAGELHVKSGKVLTEDRIPELDAALDISMLADEASYEYRAQMCRTSARDFVEAVLLDIHFAQHLAAHPHVRVRGSLEQDRLLGDAEATLMRHGNAEALDRLRKKARASNLADSRGRLKTDWIEPETLFWEAWKALPKGEQAAIAREAISGFIERVEQAAQHDRRLDHRADPMEWHRHRIHPLLWRALDDASAAPSDNDPVQRELALWQAHRKRYLSRRPRFSQVLSRPPWKGR